MMKLLLENWRQYLNEQELNEVLAKKWGEWTIADLEDLIKMSRQGEEKSIAQRWLAKTLGTEFLKLIPYVGTGVAAAEVLINYYKQLTRSPEEADTAAQFPILGKLNMDPHLIRTIEDDILNQIDEKYQKYLSSLSPDMLIKDVVSINEFIRSHIAALTAQHVVIDDESKGSKE